MTTAELKQQVLELPEEERLEVAEAIWTSLEDRDRLPLPEWQKVLLDERLAASESETGRDWEEVEAAVWPAAK
jgi:putative addiction module component (TIGR02574 family)